MKRNKLYTVNKWNKPAIIGYNLFYDGGLANAALEDKHKNPWDYADDIDTTYQYTQHLKGNYKADPSKAQYLANYGTYKMDNPLSFREAFGKNALKGGLKAGAGAAISAGAGLVGGLAGNLIGGGLHSGAGDAIGSIGGTVGSAVGSVNPLLGAAVSVGSQLIGGLTNAAFGTKVDEARLNAAKSGTSQLNNFVSNASSFDDIQGIQSVANVQDAYKGGWFTSGDARKKNAELQRQREQALAFAQNSLTNNIHNISEDQINDALANYSAYGGPLDTFGSGALGIMQNDKYLTTIDNRSNAIANRNTNGFGQGAFTGGAKTFADGGLKAAFMDEFGTDPIGAAVRYSRGMEQLEAQKEAAAAEAQREAEYAAMQQRLANLETQNQGLQAIMSAMPTISDVPVAEEPLPSYTPSKAARTKGSGNSTWDYIEGQLRKSGKFNDVQIEGIKYNLQRESSIDPNAVGDGGAAFGLGQWHGKRQPKDRSLEGQTQHLIDTLSNFDGKEHWVGRGNYEGFMNARTPEEAHYYIARGYERPAQRIVDKVKRDSDMSLKRLNAFGGELGTNGTDFTNGLLYVDEGGSHESNPLEGVPMGVDAEGIPNLVEEGETVYNDYVFSDRMMVPDFMYKELGLGGTMKKKGISFADASKKLAQESEQRPNDPISEAGLKASLSKLAEVQETERMKQQAEEYMGLEGYACGGKMKKYACGGKKGNMYWGWGDQPNQFTPWWPQTTAVNTVGLTPAELKVIAEEQKKAKVQAEAAMEGVKKTGKTVSNNRSSNNAYGPRVSTAATSAPIAPSPGMTDEEFRSAFPMIARPDDTPVGTDYTDGSFWKGLGTNPAVPSQSAEENIEDYTYNPYPTWMRYAPVFGAGIMSLTDALGLTNRPDYTMANKLEAAATRAGYAPNVRYKPIGDYMRYSPLDRQYYINQLMASSRATDRSINNVSTPSRNAALLANGYNTTLSLGNLARQAEDYNRAMYERTKEFNRKTNMFNSQMGLEAAMANARYQQQAAQLGLSGLGQAAALRDAIDARIGAAKSANLTNFLTSLGNIGRENFALNQINSDRSRQYGLYSDGTSTYKRSARGKKGSRWT